MDKTQPKSVIHNDGLIKNNIQKKSRSNHKSKVSFAKSSAGRLYEEKTNACKSYEYLETEIDCNLENELNNAPKHNEKAFDFEISQIKSPG